MRDANGIRLAHIYARDDLHQSQFGQHLEHLTTDEARRIANGIARLPELMMRYPGFCSRDGGDFRWKRSHPYNVAFADRYVCEHSFFIDAVCKLNDLPFDPTGQRIKRYGASWCVYEFALQLHAIQFWEKPSTRYSRYSARSE